MEPSPAISNTSLFGNANCAPIAAGKPYPIVPKPPEDIQVRGFLYLKNCAAHIWFWPTSVAIIASPFVISYIFSTTNCGFITSFCS